MSEGVSIVDLNPATILDKVLGTANGDAGLMSLADLVALVVNQASITITGATPYPTTAAGLAATAEGGYFSVVPGTADPATAIAIYREVSGAAVLLSSVASAALVNAINSRLTIAEAKLAGIAPNATANATDAFLRGRANHTGSQSIATVEGLAAALAERAAVYNDLVIDTRDRPGLSPLLFTTALTGDPELAAPIAQGSVAVNDDPSLGRVLRLTGADVDLGTGFRDVATKRLLIYRPGRTYAVVFGVARFQNPSDPSQNAVELRTQNLSANWTSVSNARLGPALELATTDTQRFFTFLIGKEGAPGDLDYTVPPTAYAGKFHVRVFGVGQQTDVALVGFYDVTDQVAGGVGLGEIQQQIADAVAALNADIVAVDERVAASEQAVALVQDALSAMGIDVDVLKALIRSSFVPGFNLMVPGTDLSFFSVTRERLGHKEFRDLKKYVAELAARLPSSVSNTVGGGSIWYVHPVSKRWFIEIHPTKGLRLSAFPDVYFGPGSASGADADTTERVGRLESAKTGGYHDLVTTPSRYDYRYMPIYFKGDSRANGPIDAELIDGSVQPGMQMFVGGPAAGGGSAAYASLVPFQETSAKGETGLRAMGARMIQSALETRPAIDTVTGGRTIFLGASGGWSGHSMLELLNSTEWARTVNQVVRFKELADEAATAANGGNAPADAWRNFGIAGVVLFNQGRAYLDGDSSETFKRHNRVYIEKLTQLFKDVMGDQEYLVPIVVDYFCGHKYYPLGYTSPVYGEALMELQAEIPNLIVWGPTFPLPYPTFGGIQNIHTGGAGCIISGAMAGEVFHLWHTKGVKWRPVHIRKSEIIIANNKITLPFNAVRGEMDVDDSIVTDPGGKGAVILDRYGSPLTITNVARTPDSVHEIDVTYAGGIPKRVQGGWMNGVPGGFGRGNGPRHCFRDRHGRIGATPRTVAVGGGVTYPLDNFAIPFDVAV